MPELQGEALQVLTRPRERRFGNEDRAFGSASHEDRCWGPDKSAGKEGGCYKGESIPRSNAKYVFLSFLFSIR